MKGAFHSAPFQTILRRQVYERVHYHQRMVEQTALVCPVVLGACRGVKEAVFHQVGLELTRHDSVQTCGFKKLYSL